MNNGCSLTKNETEQDFVRTITLVPRECLFDSFTGEPHMFCSFIILTEMLTVNSIEVSESMQVQI